MRRFTFAFTGILNAEVPFAPPLLSDEADGLRDGDEIVVVGFGTTSVSTEKSYRRSGSMRVSELDPHVIRIDETIASFSRSCSRSMEVWGD
jgi:hypothetical protein